MTKINFLSTLMILLFISCDNSNNSQKADTQNLPETEKNRLRDSIDNILFKFNESGQKVDETPYHKAIYNIDTINIKYLTKYADHLSMTGNIKEALRLLNNTLKWTDKKAQIYSCIGDNWQIEAGLRAQKKIDVKPAIDSAVFYYEKACLADPNDVDLFVTLNIVHAATGKYELAIKDIEHAMKLQPENRTHYLFRGSTKYNLGDYKGAYDDLRIITSVRRSEYEWFYYRALSAIELQMYNEAKLDLDTCEMLNYKSADLYYYRGVLKTNLDDKQNGYREIKKAMEMGYPVPQHDVDLVNKKLSEKTI